jgi:acyl carrier protein
MSIDPFLHEIRRYLTDDLGAATAELADDEPLLGDWLDSMGALKVADHLEERYGITIGAHEMDPENFGTLRSLAEFVARKVAAP